MESTSTRTSCHRKWARNWEVNSGYMWEILSDMNIKEKIIKIQCQNKAAIHEREMIESIL